MDEEGEWGGVDVGRDKVLVMLLGDLAGKTRQISGPPSGYTA